MSTAIYENSAGLRLGHTAHVAQLVADGATILDAPPSAAVGKDGRRCTVCVLHVDGVDQTLWVYADFELARLARATDMRRKTWLHYPLADARAR
jgi:hypothetical protein